MSTTKKINHSFQVEKSGYIDTCLEELREHIANDIFYLSQQGKPSMASVIRYAIHKTYQAVIGDDNES